MRYYQPNPACRCGRCSTRGLMGPAVLVTLGILFLLANTTDFPFERTWPILLIVIGAIRIVRYVVPDTGHVNPGQYPLPYPGQYPPPQGTYAAAMPNATSATPASGPVVTPPPPPIAGELGEGSDKGEVHNG